MSKTQNNIVIREATAEDLPVIFSFIKEIAEYEKLPHQVAANEEVLNESLFGKRRYAEVLIAENNGEPAGHAVYFHNFSTFIGRPGIYLEDLYVRPQFRSKGIGKALLISLIKIAKERNCGRLEWAVLDWNEPAISFYKKMGAVPMDDWTVFRLTEDKIKGFDI